MPQNGILLRKGILVRYGVAVGTVMVTLAVKIPLDRAVGGGAPFQLFSLAILISAWFGGWGPGLLATVLSTAIGAMLAPPGLSPPGVWAGALTLRSSIFLFQGIGISLIGHSLARARRQAQESYTALVADVEERHRLDRELAGANRRAVELLESINDAFFSLDREWRFTYLNRVFSRYIGRQPGELIGKGLWDEYPGLLGTAYEESYRRAVREGVPVRFEARGALSGRWFQVYAYPSEDGLSVFSTDIAEQKNARQEAERAHAEAEAANRMKDQFLATLSHELRTPLNAILGWVQILRAGRLDAEGMARGLETIERNSRAQAQLIGDLLDISGISSGKLRLEVRPVDPAEAVEAALATVQPAAQARGVRIERLFEAGVGPALADPDRLQQVVWNLLSNAVKFTPRDGRVEVRLEAVGGQAEIRVRDTGQGIAPEFLPHVFELFRQADGSAGQLQGGLGLGLAIVRQLVELQGGSVRAESPGTGHGATFTVVLPLAGQAAPKEERPAARAVERGESSRLPLAGLRLLAVDDEPDTLDVMAELLSLRGAEVATASSAAEALALFQDFDPDVLVSDIGMPERDGYDLIREIRTRCGPEDLPAVAVTAFAAPEDRRRALSAGFQVHLAKPVDPGELVDVIARLAAAHP
ncbi:MAG TPA: ATP-binding protein [Thermoanaerobaculia bacterium]|nr:ATP-binding protein [Thermoanaerobaculia bacterium]